VETVSLKSAVRLRSTAWDIVWAGFVHATMGRHTIIMSCAYGSGAITQLLYQRLLDRHAPELECRSEFVGAAAWAKPLHGDEHRQDVAAECRACAAGNCEYPWEFPAFGRFGCKPDCGVNSNTTKIAVNIRADFTGHPVISPRVLMSGVRWNLCLNDEERTARGEPDLCWCAGSVNLSAGTCVCV
jgi:hypothetical protein